ncbi:MAG: substrate-binding domain-containing protein [Kiritimatiellae bacterium]|nr:substrate-binding domain-containing protein [Kiritimatiellia bacterium]
MERSLPWDMRFFSDWDLQDRKAWNKLVLGWKPDGIYLNSPHDTCHGRFKRIPNVIAFESPDMRINMRFPRQTVFVGIDNRQIAAEAFRLLAKRGLQHFAYVHPSATSEDISHSQVRATTFMRMAEDAGFDCTECQRERHTAADWASSLVALAAELSALPRPCGVMAYNDRSAHEVIDACNYAKLHIPEQIQIVGVDNQEDICENILPRLTSIEPDFLGVGRLAAQRMEELLATGRTQNHLTCGVLRIAERDTTRDLSGSARLVTAAEKLIRSHACQGLPPSPKGLTVQGLAALLRVSRSLLEMRFSAVRGEGVAAAIRRRKLEEVCRMLTDTNLPIGEIADRCGFPAQTHLNALFRRTFGTTLRAYRNETRNLPSNGVLAKNFRNFLV